MLHKLICHTYFELTANQITWSRLLRQIHILNAKQCGSISVGFSRSQLIWIYTVCKRNVYPGSAGQGLIIYNHFQWEHLQNAISHLTQLFNCFCLLFFFFFMNRFIHNNKNLFTSWVGKCMFIRSQKLCAENISFFDRSCIDCTTYVLNINSLSYLPLNWTRPFYSLCHSLLKTEGKTAYFLSTYYKNFQIFYVIWNYITD